MSPESTTRILELLQEIAPYVDSNTEIDDLINDGVTIKVNEALQNENLIDAAISDINNNPIV